MDGTARKGYDDEARGLCPEDTGGGSVLGVCRHGLSCMPGRQDVGRGCQPPVTCSKGKSLAHVTLAICADSRTQSLD